MSENLTLPPVAAVETAIDAAPAPPIGPALAAGEPAYRMASAPSPASPAASPSSLLPEAHAMLELIGRGLAPDADESARSAARDLWARFAQLIMASGLAMPPAPMMPTAPMMPAAPVMPPASMLPAASMLPPAAAMPTAPAIPPMAASPIAMAARALRQMPPDQLMDLLLQRLRGALPSGATVPTPTGIQFALVPVPAPQGSR